MINAHASLDSENQIQSCWPDAQAQKVKRMGIPAKAMTDERFESLLGHERVLPSGETGLGSQFQKGVISCHMVR
jgi:hypothetical protein